ncbi:hypothetical protein LXL04_003231 [Taraxacum kok-saghyz]
MTYEYDITLGSYNDIKIQEALNKRSFGCGSKPNTDLSPHVATTTAHSPTSGYQSISSCGLSPLISIDSTHFTSEGNTLGVSAISKLPRSRQSGSYIIKQNHKNVKALQSSVVVSSKVFNFGRAGSRAPSMHYDNHMLHKMDD